MAGGRRARQRALEEAGRREVRLFRREERKLDDGGEGKVTEWSNQARGLSVSLGCWVSFFPTPPSLFFILHCVYIFSDLPVTGERRSVPPEMRRLCELALGSCPPRSALRLGTC